MTLEDNHLIWLNQTHISFSWLAFLQKISSVNFASHQSLYFTLSVWTVRMWTYLSCKQCDTRQEDDLFSTSGANGGGGWGTGQRDMTCFFEEFWIQAKVLTAVGRLFIYWGARKGTSWDWVKHVQITTRCKVSQMHQILKLNIVPIKNALYAPAWVILAKKL